MAYDSNKLKGLFSRVYNNEMIDDKDKGLSDEKDIKAYVTKVFGDGGSTPDPSMLHQFNTLVVQQADKIAKPMVTDMLGLFASVQQKPRGQIVQINIPRRNKAKVIWSANGSGVDLVRVAGQDKTLAVPATFSAGFYYEPIDLVTDSVEKFRELINDVANAKVRLYLDEIYKLIDSAIATGKIPAANVEDGSGLTVADYNKVASTLQRYGGKPVFVADTLLIDHFAQSKASAEPVLVPENIKEELYSALNITNIGRTTAVNLVNPFTDETNTKTELPVNRGYMFAGSVNQKPLSVVEYGGMRQFTEQDPEDERVKIKLVQEASIKFLFGEAIGVIEDDTITL